MDATTWSIKAVIRFACLLLFIASLFSSSVASVPEMSEISSDTSGTVGNPYDTVSIKAQVTNGDGLFISQYGEPGYLRYVSRSAGMITSDDQRVQIVYMCISTGSSIPLRLSIYQDSKFVKEITRYVRCEEQYSSADISEIDSDTSGQVGSDEDLVSIRATATGAEGLHMTQYGEPGFLQYISHSTDTITSNTQTVWIRYKCMAQGKDMPLRIIIAVNNRVAASLTKYVTCSLQNIRLTAVDSDTRGMVSSAEDAVWVKARASNAKGVSISQWGDPAYLAYVGRSIGTVSENDQQIQTTYRCIAPGQDIPLKIRLVYNNYVLNEVTAYVTCSVPSVRFTETESKLTGTLGTNEDQVWIKARALNANGMRIGQYGEPGYLEYVTRSASGISADDQEIMVIYRCTEPGNNIPLRVSLNSGGRLIKEVTRYVTCKEINNPPELIITDSKQTAVVGGSDDLVWLKVKATNAKGMSIGQYGEPGHLSYVNRSANMVSSDSQEYIITYRCIAPGTNMQLKTWIAKNGEEVLGVSRNVTCNRAS